MKRRPAGRVKQPAHVAPIPQWRTARGGFAGKNLQLAKLLDDFFPTPPSLDQIYVAQQAKLTVCDPDFQMMPIFPVTRVRDADEGIDFALQLEHPRRHTFVMHSDNLSNLSRMARECNASIFVKNGPALAGLGFKGEGPTSFTIASPTGEGMTTPKSFSRWRRCTLVGAFRIV